MDLNKSKMKVSIYTKSGERAATTYYRIYQYICKIPGIYRYRKMLSDSVYKKVMPISSRNICEKIIIFFYTFLRVQFQLIKDVIDRPDVLIISRRFINRVLPFHFKVMLNYLKQKGTKIIWDFDDQIIESREVSEHGFEYMSSLSDHIVVASPVNREMVNKKYRNKVILLPTTDGDMYSLFSVKITENRLKKLENVIRLVWVGTSVSLKYVKTICPYIDEFAKRVASEYGKQVSLTIVCDMALSYHDFKHVILRNVKWERDIAIKEMLNSHIGLMPLENNKFSKGKGGFKLIQYLSVGLPIIGNPIGINNEIISNDVGIKIDNLDSTKWIEALLNISETKEIWLNLSNAAYSKWQRDYSYSQNLNVWKTILNKN